MRRRSISQRDIKGILFLVPVIAIGVVIYWVWQVLVAIVSWVGDAIHFLISSPIGWCIDFSIVVTLVVIWFVLRKRAAKLEVDEEHTERTPQLRSPNRKPFVTDPNSAESLLGVRVEAYFPQPSALEDSKNNQDRLSLSSSYSTLTPGAKKPDGDRVLSRTREILQLVDDKKEASFVELRESDDQFIWKESSVQPELSGCETPLFESYPNRSEKNVGNRTTAIVSSVGLMKQALQQRQELEVTETGGPSASFYDKFGQPIYRCQDGHFVRSKAEVTVDDFLHQNKIRHVYECTLPFNTSKLCDFYLPDFKTYVEYWGLISDLAYVANMKEKLTLYEEAGLNVISLFQTDLSKLEDQFETHLNRFGFSYRDRQPEMEFNYEIPRSFLAIDFETANHKRSSACSIGLVLVEDLRVIKQLSFLIRPPTTDFFFTSYHGISWDDVKDELTFDKVWDQVAPLFKNSKVVIAHNVSFDQSVLFATLDLYKIERPVLNFSCTLKESRKRIISDNYKLDTIAKKLGIQLKHHNALSDALACAKIMIYLSEKESTPLSESGQ
jgi:DNA polymerase-3 subunit epsilon